MLTLIKGAERFAPEPLGPGDVLVAGGVVLALLQPVLGRFRPGGRASAALFGLVHGAVVLTVLGYALLMGFDGPERPGWIRMSICSKLKVAP